MSQSRELWKNHLRLTRQWAARPSSDRRHRFFAAPRNLIATRRSRASPHADQQLAPRITAETCADHIIAYYTIELRGGNLTRSGIQTDNARRRGGS